MTDPKPLTIHQLSAIEARVTAATPGPWCTDSWEIYQGSEYQPGISMWIGETCRGTTSLERDRDDAAFVAAARTDVPALVAEVRRLQSELAEYEVLNPQQCPAGKHADWLVDSEYAHACPWCQIEALKGVPADTKQLDDQAVQILSNEGAQCGSCGDEPGDRDCPDCEKCRARYVAALRSGGWAPKAERELAPIEDTLPAWLAQRFDPRGPEWSALADDDRTYWEHHAAAVRRAVARGGFKTAEEAQR